MIVKLTYFKDTGKYYTEGSYSSTLDNLGDIWHEVQNLRSNGALPGLTPGYPLFYILIDVPDHRNNHPKLLII